IHAAYSRLAVVLVLTFLGIPFVVRTLEPVLESMEDDKEEAAYLLGASRGQTFWRVIFPPLLPPLITGFALSRPPGLGEDGWVWFVVGKMVLKREMGGGVIVMKLEEFKYAEATAIAIVLLVISFAMLVVINFLQQWSNRQYA